MVKNFCTPVTDCQPASRALCTVTLLEIEKERVFCDARCVRHERESSYPVLRFLQYISPPLCSQGGAHCAERLPHTGNIVSQRLTESFCKPYSILLKGLRNPFASLMPCPRRACAHREQALQEPHEWLFQSVS